MIAKAMPSELRSYVYGANLCSAIVRHGKMPKGTYGAMLGALVADGLAKTKPCLQSKRNKFYALTAQGKKAIKKHEKKHEKARVV